MENTEVRVTYNFNNGEVIRSWVTTEAKANDYVAYFSRMRELGGYQEIPLKISVRDILR